jgi:hypothetical protein
MEKKINKFKELKVGDVLLIDNPIIKDDVCVLSSIHETYKYPISDKNGRKWYNKDIDNKIVPICADVIGETGEEMINEYCILSSKAGSYDFREDDVPIWNISVIDKNHPKYDESISNAGKKFGSMFDMFSKMF